MATEKFDHSLHQSEIVTPWAGEASLAWSLCNAIFDNPDVIQASSIAVGVTRSTGDLKQISASHWVEYDEQDEVRLGRVERYGPKSFIGEVILRQPRASSVSEYNLQVRHKSVSFGSPYAIISKRDECYVAELNNSNPFNFRDNAEAKILDDVELIHRCLAN